jgi:hypothetical protein
MMGVALLPVLMMLAAMVRSDVESLFHPQVHAQAAKRAAQLALNAMRLASKLNRSLCGGPTA